VCTFCIRFVSVHSICADLPPHKLFSGELGWRSGESARLPPMCPRFDSRNQRPMWAEFVVGSRPSSEGFSPGSPVFLPPQKSTYLNSNSIRNSRATGLSVERLLCATLVKRSQFILFISVQRSAVSYYKMQHAAFLLLSATSPITQFDKYYKVRLAVILLIVSITKFSIVIVSPRAFLSRNRRAITRCPIIGVRVELFVIAYQ